MKKFEALFAKHSEKIKLWGISLYPPATAEDIKALETVVGQKLPEEIVNFYSHCNGFQTDDWLFNMLSIDQILCYKSELETTEFYIAEYMIYSDHWNIKLEGLNDFSITNGNHSKELQLVLTHSIYEFLDVYFNSDGILSADNGLYKWFEEKKIIASTGF